MWVRARAASSKETVSSVPTWFRADSGTNLFKQGEFVTGWSCGSVAQRLECSHGKRETLGSSPGRTTFFFLVCDIWTKGKRETLGSSPGRATFFFLACDILVQMSQTRKKNVVRPGLEPRVSRLPCEHSNRWATESHDQPVTNSPCLNRFVPESARNHVGTDDTVSLLLAARARTHTEPPNVTGKEKERGPTGTRTQGLSLTVRAL